MDFSCELMKGQAVELSTGAERDAAESDVAITQSFFFPFVLYLRILDVCACVCVSLCLLLPLWWWLHFFQPLLSNITICFISYIHSNVSALASWLSFQCLLTGNVWLFIWTACLFVSSLYVTVSVCWSWLNERRAVLPVVTKNNELSERTYKYICCELKLRLESCLWSWVKW